MNLSTSKVLDGVETDVAINYYADRVLILVTQLGKVGSLIQASIPATVPLLAPSSTVDGMPLIEPPAAVELTTLFGSAPSGRIATLHSLYATHIATLVWTMNSTDKAADNGDRRNIIVGLALKKQVDDRGDSAVLSEREQAIFRGVIKTIVELVQGTDTRPT
ncbi:uncharacterized protein FOMMEDRAFT_155118 [Fomitiporia mediterranea MF3/22]|uniref:uncharacterized protein n=1 Tax=Fomitiporia mediterranea (strain MF3/22) TaxID=694068 RepID=UPI00044091E8|nr:uncharacterized protein FOMMEDRAFT_155118 [Fomitiporia mediterranea MF3/22]EJD03995.1 hypothetical protein FOMMEDRAFT_155118 [Fomitiporia mediterranea MF3/22]